jgi:hypothetical protein
VRQARKAIHDRLARLASSTVNYTIALLTPGILPADMQALREDVQAWLTAEDADASSG